MPSFSSVEVFYPLMLLLVASGFWGVLKLRPDMRSAFWFALSFICCAAAFGVEFVRFYIPFEVKALLMASFYCGIGAFFVVGLIVRSEQKPPYGAIFSIAAASSLALWVSSFFDVHFLVRVCFAQITVGLLLFISLFYARRQIETVTDRAVIAITAITMTALFVQPLLIWYFSNLQSGNGSQNIYALLISFGVVTTSCSILLAVIFGYEYVTTIIADLKQTANRDTLTGILNRRGFEEAINGVVEQAEASASTVAFIMLDIDHFKQINDTYGHGFGDDVIQALGSLLKAHKGQNGLAARLGGEEFVLTFPVSSLGDACSMADLVRERWERHCCYADGLEVRSTASFGVALHKAGDPIGQTMARADEALYGAKQSGRNNVKSEADLQVAKLRMAAAHMTQANEGVLHIIDDAKDTPQKHH